MGLLDILNGMMHGPRGQRQPGSSGGGGGMSPIMIALLGLLAYKALKGRGDHGANPNTAGRPHAPGGTVSAGTAGGGLGDILGELLGGKRAGAPGGKPAASLSELIPGGLGSLFGGAAAGTVLSGALDDLIKGFQDSGHGRTVQSWVGTGPNQKIAPEDLADALGSDTIEALSRQTGMRREELLAGLSQHLPDLIDQLTPKGRLPTEEEAARMV